ncbi:RNA polymerase sigma factor [Ruania halotolerans]|uniref:RNA polymerase sigma factor n=1 Tax=Ruania halotolerans TaxID=2897773 RepID=UPI001E4031BC|nr:DUF6596 domain-containing protein [Ruania halotolerans]UFU08304.1 RNA polymerase subunit sigma-24 [Ruania halotolerans]
MDDLLRTLGPRTLAVLVRRGAEFTAAEDAVQEALLEAARRWPEARPADPAAWLVRVAWRKFLDAVRADEARRRREVTVAVAPPPGATEEHDDTLLLLTRCCHPDLSPASAIALTLRAVGGLTTAQIARAYLVPEATMAQRISRAKRTLAGARFDRLGASATVLHVLYLVFNEGFTGKVDLAEEAIRLTRQLAAAESEPETHGLLALMLLHHARRAARFTGTGELVPLDEQDRSRWDTAMIAEGVEILQRALAQDRHGEYQVQAAIAALHDDAPRAEETDWPQILSWYDELMRLSGASPVVALNRAVAVGQTDGPLAGLRALQEVPDGVPRRDAVAAWLSERAGDTARAAELYVLAARAATSEPERRHLLKRAAHCARGGLPA